jgi:hypothetical protein
MKLPRQDSRVTGSLVTLADGSQVRFDLASPGRLEDTCFILGIRKCGSSIMNSMLGDLAGSNGRHYLDVAGGFFQADVPERVWRHDTASRAVLVPGQVHGGFRAMPLIFTDHPVYRDARKILLVRDPRDALVSEYFSNAYSHTLPQQNSGGGATQEMLALRQTALQASIEDYVLKQAAPLNRTFVEYAGAAADPRTRIFRYEDVILAKRQWMKDIAAHFQWTAPAEGLLDGMMSWADVVPATERRDQFIRKVTPGDHKEKLSPEIIRRLNEALSPALRLFGY